MKQIFARRACAALAAALAFAGPAAAEGFTGLVHPLHDVELGMGAGGYVTSLPVKPGQQVRAGQLLLGLDDSLQSIEARRRRVTLEDGAELQAARERLRVVQRLYDDARQVFERTGSISRDELSRLEVEYVSAKGRLEQLEAQKRRERLEVQGAEQEVRLRRLTAPVAGVVTRVGPKLGEWVKPGEPLLRLVDPSRCELRLSVPLRAASALAVGMALPVRFEEAARTEPVEGKISYVSRVADAASGLVELRVAFANPGWKIRPGIKGLIELGDARGAR